MPKGIYKHTKEQNEKISKKLKVTMKNKNGTTEWGKNIAKARWYGHIAKPKKVKGLWKTTRDPVLQQSKKRFRNMRYKIRKMECEGTHSFGDWELLKKQYGFVCPCCGRKEPEIKLTEDHIIPLSRGGSDFIENIQPLCLSCNVRKHTASTKFELKGGD